MTFGKTSLFGLLALGALGLTAAPACVVDSGACTLIGCSSSVGVDVANLVQPHVAAMPLTVELCFDGTECDTFTLETAEDSTSLQINLPTETFDDGTFDVVATVTDAQGVELERATNAVEVTNSSPNGEECGPTCTQGNTTFAAP